MGWWGGGVEWWGGVVASYPLLSQAPTPVEVELGCDNINVFSVQTLRSFATDLSQECVVFNQSVEIYDIFQ